MLPETNQQQSNVNLKIASDLKIPGQPATQIVLKSDNGQNNTFEIVPPSLLYALTPSTSNQIGKESIKNTTNVTVLKLTPQAQPNPVNQSLQKRPASNSKEAIDEILKQVLKKETFKCQFCSKVYKRKESYENHVLNHQRSKEFTCQICGTTNFKNKRALSVHQATHMSKAFICDICDARFKDKILISDHMLLHRKSTTDLRFKCEECDRAFKKIQFLEKHQRSHIKICDNRFDCLEALETHLRSFHAETETKQYNCEICHYTTNTKSKIVQHEAIHVNLNLSETPFKCLKNECGKSFRRKADLNKHHRLYHSEGSKVSCSKCTLIFEDSKTFLNHWSTCRQNYSIQENYSTEFDLNFTVDPSLIKTEIDTEEYKVTEASTPEPNFNCIYIKKEVIDD